MDDAKPGRVIYGPPWPDPENVVGFLEQITQFARGASADNRPFQPQRAIVILLDDRGDRYSLAESVHGFSNSEALAALRVAAGRFARALDPDGAWDPEE